MARALRVTCLMVVVLACGGRPAEARWAFLDWMEELSGPGPFTGGPGLVATVCNFRDLRGAFSEDKRKPCFYFDFRHVEAKDSDNFREFGEVGATSYDFGATWQLYRPIEVGVGGGFVRFAANGESTTKFTLAVPRLAVKPLLMLTPTRHWGGTWAKWASVPKLYVRESVILGNLKATDFGVAPGLSTFDVDNDQVTSFGLMLDFTELWR